jgi:methylenetetrahydrofolate reductase (NADPH)
MKAGSNLEKILEKGLFAVTGELGPPKGNEVSIIKRKADLLRGYVDAVNVTDNQTAIVRMSSIATSSLLIQMGLEPVMQMVTRDRNRIAIQSDIFGATALGIKNMLCLSGDHHTFGNQVDSKNVHDLDSIQLIQCVRMMRDEGKLLGGEEKIEGEVKLFIGAAENPFGDPFEFRAIRLGKKVTAGVNFIQTQCIYDMNRFKEWMKMVRDRGLHEKVHIMAGVTPPSNLEVWPAIWPRMSLASSSLMKSSIEWSRQKNRLKRESKFVWSRFKNLKRSKECTGFTSWPSSGSR